MAITWPAKNNYATGDVLTATNMNGIGDDLNDLYSQTVSGGSAYAAGKNKIINGDFGIWQRGTSFSLSTGVITYTADRFVCYVDGTVTCTASQQAFTAGTAPVAGYESTYFLRTNTTSQSGGTGTYQGQRIEDVRTFAGQTVTFSFWAKADSARTYSVYLAQNFGSGGSASVNTSNSSISVTTSWARYSATFTLGSVAGKTIGTGSRLEAWVYGAANTANTLDTWGWQVEAGSTASIFQTATGTIQGELAACSRYYYRVDSANASDTRMNTVTMIANSTTVAYGAYIFPVRMRTSPTFGSSTASGWSLGRIAAACTAMAQERASQYSSMVKATVSSGLTVGQGDWLEAGNNNTAWIEFSAEL